ncbi:MAG: isoprenylcysteine carboxylmethyltransferase family protein [Halioglobus sp.]
MRDFLTLFLPVYAVVFFGLVFVWRTWRAWKQTGINPYRLMNNPGPEVIIGRYFRLLPLLSLGVGAAYILSPWAYAQLAPFVWLDQLWLKVMGVLLMCLALVVAVVAQAQMGASWRIGVDYDHETSLVNHGLFQYSRNPIFCAIMLSVLGFFLALPNAITLLIVMLDLILIEVQIRLEEDRLTQLHGDTYINYCARVRRWA